MRESESSMENETLPVGDPNVARPMSDVALFLIFFFLFCFASWLFWTERVIILSLHLSKVSCNSFMVSIATCRFSSATTASIGMSLEEIGVEEEESDKVAVIAGEAAARFGAEVGETCDVDK